MSLDAWCDDFLRNGERFKRYTAYRIRLLRERLGGAKRDVFDLIPFLLHEHDPSLPGGGGGQPSCGISGFAYTPELQKLIKAYFPSFLLKRQAKRRLEIAFVALHGSAGTLGFTAGSDLDFWIGVDTPDASAHSAEMLREKLLTIERWAGATAGLEVHFFASNLEKLRHDDYGELSRESCGSTMGKLLKDEFYRTGLFLAGKLPFYWLMPARTNDAAYFKNIAALSLHGSFLHESYIDLGNISSIGSHEYFGAALWQVLKGLRFPFKSVIKISLIDQYSAQGDRAIALCDTLKERLFLTPNGTETPDPYLFLVESLRTFYVQREVPSAKELIEECFLIRSLCTDDQTAAGANDRAKLFRSIGRQWGWRSDALERLARFYEWDYYKREDLRKRIVSFLIDTCRTIHRRTGTIRSAISDRDMTIISKRLRSHLERQQGKVPYEFFLLPARELASVVLQEQADKLGKRLWVVRLGLRGGHASAPLVSQQIPDPIAACAWCSLNGVATKKLSFEIHGKSSLTVGAAVALIRRLDSFFPHNIDALNVSDFLAPAHISHMVVLPNWDEAQWNHDIISLYVLLRTSTGELYAEHASGGASLDWFCQTILRQRIGAEYAAELRWIVYVCKGRVGSTMTVSRRIAHQIEHFVAWAALHGLPRAQNAATGFFARPAAENTSTSAF